jgi:hypothetical protein
MTVGTYFQPGINYYVPQMQQSPGVGEDGLYSVSLGVPAATAANAIIAAGAGVFTSAGASISVSYTVDATFGRTISVTGATAGDNAAVTVRGQDYLSQPIAETLTLAGVAAVAGNKAFKRVESVTVAAGNANANSSLLLGTSTKLGLPFKTNFVMAEYNGDVLAAAGTLAQPVLTDPQLATSGDPRGTYVPSTALNGVNVINITAHSSRNANSNNNGGLHGIRQYA